MKDVNLEHGRRPGGGILAHSITCSGMSPGAVAFARPRRTYASTPVPRGLGSDPQLPQPLSRACLRGNGTIRPKRRTGRGPFATTPPRVHRALSDGANSGRRGRKRKGFPRALAGWDGGKRGKTHDLRRIVLPANFYGLFSPGFEKPTLMVERGGAEPEPPSSPRRGLDESSGSAPPRCCIKVGFSNPGLNRP